jgi:hypothetical protein
MMAIFLHIAVRRTITWGRGGSFFVFPTIYTIIGKFDHFFTVFVKNIFKKVLTKDIRSAIIVKRFTLHHFWMGSVCLRRI